MSDNRRRYRAIKEGLMQLYPTEVTGRLRQRLQVLAMLVSGIVGSRSTHNREVAKKAASRAKVESRIKQVSRWYQNEHITYEMHYLPFVKPLVAHLASSGPLVISIDGSAVGRGCLTLMVSLVYQKRAIPLIWTVVDRSKGHLSAQEHIALLAQLQALLPADTQVILLGDGEFDSVELLDYLEQQNWQYVCRTAKDTQVRIEDEWVQLAECAYPGQCSGWQAGFTAHAYGPLTVVVWWETDYAHPLYLVSNLELVQEVCHWYRHRMRIETLFSDQKSRGFALDKSHVSDPARLFRILMAACLAYIWMIYLGVFAHQHDYLPIIHRTDRCDLSLFQLGLDFLEHCLNEDLVIPVAFLLPPDFLFV